MSGYTSCACRDCMDVSTGGLCAFCEEADCTSWDGDEFARGNECQRDDAYGDDDYICLDYTERGIEL